jgi:hypothetical protein
VATPDSLLEGSIDLHAHGSPEFATAMPGRVSNLEWARLASRAKMRGFVVKSHIFPTIGAVSAMREVCPELELFSSITLNPPVGGIDPTTVELAIAGGVKVVWMPTWAARQDSPKHSVFLERMKPYVSTMDAEHWPAHGLTTVDSNGALLPEVEHVLQLCARAGVTVASGHLPISQSLALCERVSALGGSFVLTHPLSGSVGAPLDQQVAIAELGGMIEHVFIGCMPMHQRTDPARIVEAIEAVGAEHCVLSSDSIENWNPPQPEIMRMYVASLLSLGVDEESVHLMTHDNPARVLGLDASWTPYGDDAGSLG